MNTLKNNLFFPILIAIFSAIMGSAATLWINDNYNQPQLNWLARDCSDNNLTCYYYKLGKISIGNIYIENDGYRPDTNISIKLNGVIDPKDFKIVDLTSSYEIKNIDDNKTLIKINSLQPKEDADITFQTKDSNDTYSINEIYSNSGRIKSFLSSSDWWDFSLHQVIFLIIFSVICVIFGYLITKWQMQPAKPK